MRVGPEQLHRLHAYDAGPASCLTQTALKKKNA